MRTLLAGKKTYVTALTAMVGAGLAYLTGEVTAAAAIQLAVTAVLAALVRSGSKSDAEAVINGVVPK